MNSCLVEICKEFEQIDNYLEHKSQKNIEIVNKLFFEFLECFTNLQEEKLEYPKEFQNDMKLYKEGFEPLIKKFEDTDIRYLMLSDFYDYVRLTKKFSK